MTTKTVKTSRRGSKPGERRGGRQKGTPNKATASIRDIAREYTTEAIETLVSVMAGGADIPAAAQVSAAKEILDRAYGKASTVLNGDEDGGAVALMTEIVLRGVRSRAEEHTAEIKSQMSSSSTVVGL